MSLFIFVFYRCCLLEHISIMKMPPWIVIGVFVKHLPTEVTLKEFTRTRK